jgi:WD40 repeat protein/energy-coupling factor transporter ATP-binding protein EcfA2
MKVFLSHATANTPLVEELAHRLEALPYGITCWMDKRDLIPGDSLLKAIQQALAESDVCVIFFGPGGLGAWQREEIDAAIRRRLSDPKSRLRIVPVILPGGRRVADEEMPDFLRGTLWVEFRESIQEQDSFEHLQRGIRGVPEPRKDPRPWDGGCPYVGLKPFSREEATFFFGRDALVKKLVNYFRGPFGTAKERRFLAVLGPSGSGKSSLVAAGLLPEIRTRNALPDGENWLCVQCRPGSNPWLNLNIALENHKDLSTYAPRLDTLIPAPEQACQRLHVLAELALHDKPADRRLLVVIDQFEEFFALADGDIDPNAAANRQHFLDCLLYPNQEPGSRVVVVITMRADFYGHCARHESLRQAVQENQELVGPLNAEELREAIVNPAQRCGVEVEPALVACLLHDADAKRQSGALPFLQHALKEMWASQVQHRLTVKNYRDIGGLDGAIEKHAEKAYADFALQEQELVRRIFVRLVQPCEGMDDTKRRVQLQELRRLDERADIESLVQALCAEKVRLLVTDTLTQPGQVQVELAHEALIRHWPRLKQWLNENRDLRAWEDRTRPLLAQWETKKKPELLLHGALLKEADALCEKHGAKTEPRLSAFVQRSIDHHRLMQRLKAMVVAVAAIVAVLLASTASWKWRRAEENSYLAYVEEQNAVAARVAAQAELLLSAGQPQVLQTSALLAWRSLLTAPTQEGYEALRHALRLLPLPDLSLTNADAVLGLTYTPDGACLVTASSKTAQIYDVARRTWLGHPVQHADSITSLAMSPDGETFATASMDQTAHIWNRRTGSPVGNPMNHPKGVLRASYSRNGRYLATVANDRIVRVWASNSQALVCQSAVHDEPIKDFAFSPDGSLFATASGTNVTLWETSDGHPFGVELTHSNEVTSIAFRTDGRQLVSGDQDGIARIWSSSGEQLAALMHEGALTKVIYDHTGTRIATARRKEVCVWDAGLRGSGAFPLSRLPHGDNVTSMAFSSNSVLLATGSDDSCGRVWDWRAGKELARMVHAKEVRAVAFSPDGTRLATASDDGTAKTWETMGYSEAAKFGTANQATASSFNARGDHLAIGGVDRHVRLYNLNTRQFRDCLHDEKIDACAADAEGTQLAAALKDQLWVWNLRSASNITRSLLPRPVSSLSFSPSGKLLLSLSETQAHVLAQPNWSVQGTFRHPKTVRSATFSPTQDFIATGCGDNQARIWALTDPHQPRSTLPHDSVVHALAYSPDGRHLATVTSDGIVRVYPVNASRPAATFKLSDGGACVAFDHSGKYLAAGDTANQIRVWEWTRGLPIAQFSHEMPLRAIAFSPTNDQFLTTSSTDGLVRQWLWQGRALTAEARTRVTRKLTPEERKDYFGTFGTPHQEPGWWQSMLDIVRSPW